MLEEGLWLIDPDTNEEIFASYEDLDSTIYPQIFRPIGGFCYPASAFTRLGLPPIPFYVKDWLPKQGKMVMFGRAKAGKSLLALLMARCIGSGEPFLGIPTEQGRVLYLQFEISPTILQQRMRSTGKQYPDVFVGTSFAMKLDSADGKNQLISAVEAVRPNVLILDPFYKLLKGEENESHDVLVIFDVLDSIIEMFGCSIVIFHHSGKDLERGSRGSSVFQDYPDAYIEVKRTAEDKIRITPKLLRHAELSPESIDARFENSEFVWIEPEMTVKEKLDSWAQGREEFTMSQIPIEEIGSRRMIYEALSEMLFEGKIEKTSRGVYRRLVVIDPTLGLTPQGDDVV